jgi:hypothetical protein
VFLVDPADHDVTWWQQDPPEEWAWETAEATDGDSAGQTYFHNKVSHAMHAFYSYTPNKADTNSKW